MRRNNRLGAVVGLLGIVGCSNGGPVFERSKRNVHADSGVGASTTSSSGGANSLSYMGGIAGEGAGGGVALSGSGGGSGEPTKFTGCSGACCPTDTACYSSTAGTSAPGAECLATQDNTGRDHIQLRQQWIRATAPAGNAQPLIYQILAGRSQLPWPACNQTGPIGSGGYIELMDLYLRGTDKSRHYATIGFSTYVAPPPAGVAPAVVADGFCFGSETYTGDSAYRLGPDEVGDGAGFPAGLPHPMSLAEKPWNVGPTTAKRLDNDFDLASTATRTDLIAKLAPAGDYGSAGFGGVFYYDGATGTVHGFAPLSWVAVYDAAGSTHIAVPIREVETKSRFNDSTSPNCVGAYRADALDPTTCQAGQDPLNPAWGGGDCTVTTGHAACNPGELPAATTGYFLIAELEQIFAPDLQTTLCVSYPGNDPSTHLPRVAGDGFYDSATLSCKTAKWNPADPVNGLPSGDWCAKTNAPATDDCHDAWRSRTFHAFAGAKIDLDANGAPARCAF